MLTRLALIDYDPNKPVSIVNARNRLGPKILDFLVALGMPRGELELRTQRFDTLPNNGIAPGWSSYQNVTRTRDPRKNELIGVTSYKTPFPVELRRFIFQQNYGHWNNPTMQVKSDNPRDANSGILAQACTGAFIDLTIANWDRLLREYR